MLTIKNRSVLEQVTQIVLLVQLLVVLLVEVLSLAVLVIPRILLLMATLLARLSAQPVNLAVLVNFNHHHVDLLMIGVALYVQQ